MTAEKCAPEIELDKTKPMIIIDRPVGREGNDHE
jgi:hypothetical protein